MRMRTVHWSLLGAFALACTATLAACSGDGGDEQAISTEPAGTAECIEIDSGGCLPIAPDRERVDLDEPSFSDPTNVTNPLFPISDQQSVLLLGHVEGKPFRTEVTLLPETRMIEWNGQQIETLVSQYLAYLDGRIHEVALDYYAQADDGAVWYFGEDVFNYEEGVVADTEGTWLAGKDGPAAMIMPADPQVGDVYRPENIPGFVFEQVEVKSIGETVNGPQGPLDGAIIVTELHMDGFLEDKTFAPGYGEFSTGNAGGDLEALALAVSTDALSGPVPAELQTLLDGALDVHDAAAAGDWGAASTSLGAMNSAWAAFQESGDQPPLIETTMNDALGALGPLVSGRDAAGAQNVALDAAQVALDFQLRHRPPAEIDLARFDLWLRQVLIDAAADDAAGVTGDVTTLEWVRDRFAHTLDSAEVSNIDTALADLRGAAEAEDLAAATDAAEQLREALATSLEAD